MTARSLFLLTWCGLLAVKLGLAVGLPLFGDEAFYWWESRHPAWSYSDLPPLTAWLIAVGSALFPSELGVRAPFLVLGLYLPWQLRAMAMRWYDNEAGWRAGLLAMLMPISALLGVLALPDVMMAVATLAAVDALVRAARSGRVAHWCLLGAWLAIGMLSHYRFAAVPLVMAVIVLALPLLRRGLANPDPWLAAAIGALGALPLLLFNLANDLAGLRFQFVDRHPWSWQWGGFWQVPEQLLVASPVLMAVLAWLGWSCLRAPARSPAERIVVLFATGLWVLFFVLGFFADSMRFRWHWSLPALLLLLPLLASHWPRFGRALRWAVVLPALLVSSVLFGWLALAAQGGSDTDRLGGKLFPDNLTGWREVAAWVGADAATGPIVVDNFMLAAELAFYSDESVRSRLRVLDDARNDRHGRARQLRLWSRDEAALAAEPSQPGWLVVEEGARRFSDRWPWYQSLCARFDGLVLDGVLDLHDGRRRFVRWRHDGYRLNDRCRQPAAIPALGWMDLKADPSGTPTRLEGWALQAGIGIARIDLYVDDVRRASTQRDHETHWVEGRWGDTGDPAGRTLGFSFDLAELSLSPGTRRLDVRAVRGDGLSWPIASERVVIAR